MKRGTRNVLWAVLALIVLAAIGAVAVTQKNLQQPTSTTHPTANTTTHPTANTTTPIPPGSSSPVVASYHDSTKEPYTIPTDCFLVNGYLPSNKADCTPGAIDPKVTANNVDQTICVPGYTKTVRPLVSYTDPLKSKIMVAYHLGAGQPKAGYELDHLIPLELGGAPSDPANLWPEPRNGVDYPAGDKDQMENVYHEKVCSHKMTIDEAREKMAHGGWVADFKALKGSP